MKGRQRILCIGMALLLAALLFGCAAPAPISQGENLSDQVAQASSAPAASAEATSGDKTGNGTLPVIDPGNVANSGKKIIYNATMTIEAKDAAAAINDITQTVSGMGGYISDSQYSDESSHVASTVTVRIAPEKLHELSVHIGTLGKVLSQSISSEDVTSQYTDTQARLTNAEAQETQLLAIMKQATKIDDILKVRQELNSVQQEIEQLKGQIRLMDNQVGYSTLRIMIQQPAPPAVVVEDKPKGVQFWGFAAIWQKISLGFVDSFNWTLNAIAAILIVLAKVLFPLLFVAAIVGVILLIIKLALRRQQKKQSK